MRVILRLGAVAAIAMTTGGCAIGWTHTSYPTYGNPVNPTPMPGYRVNCTTVQQLGYPLFDNMTTSCHPAVTPSYYYDEEVTSPGYHHDEAVVETSG